jgi:multidrug efflux pump subunit AcrA (membrane-fusion protein)
LIVQGDVPEASGSLMAEGQTARVRTPPTASTDLRGTVARVTAANGGKTVQLAMSWSAPLPAPGTEAQVVIQIGRKEQALLVPLSAIQMVDGKPHVTVVAGGEQRRLAVLTGLRNDREIEITVGPSEGQLVLVGQR